MARLNDEAQWIIMIGFVVSMSIFFLALVIDESTIVGQTTAEGVLEFPKSEIRNLDDEILTVINHGVAEGDNYSDLRDRISALKPDIEVISLAHQNTVIRIQPTADTTHLDVMIHFNNGVTAYNEIIRY